MPDGVECHRFELEDDEYICKLKARTGAWVDEIEIITNKGRDFDKGGDGGGANDIDFEAMKRLCVIAVGGGVGTEQHITLHHIKVFYLDLNKYPHTKKTFAKKEKTRHRR